MLPGAAPWAQVKGIWVEGSQPMGCHLSTQGNLKRTAPGPTFAPALALSRGWVLEVRSLSSAPGML